MSHYHAVVWLDHREAKLFQFSADAAEADHVAAQPLGHKLHHHASSISGKHEGGDHAFFDGILAALMPAHTWLIIGPGTAKQEFVRHIKARHKALDARVAGVETVDHPTDGEIIAMARKFFRAADRMTDRIPDRIPGQ